MAYTTKRRKQPRTFSLSPEIIEVLERYKREVKAESLTSAVEEIVREWLKTRLALQVASYYDSLSEDEIEQERAWGQFSESQM